MNISAYPQSDPLALEHRAALHPLLCTHESGISEYSFANLYLFRGTYQYQVTKIDGEYALHGLEGGAHFWIFPQGLPKMARLRELCSNGEMVKCIAASERAASERAASELGYQLVGSRADFDYLYLRENLASLRGRKFHKKRNLVNNFTQTHLHELRPLGADEVAPALRILEEWHKAHEGDGDDYHAAKEALERLGELQLCGYILYAEGRAVAFALGEGLARHRMHVIHFEKGIAGYTGVYQYINMAYATALPHHYEYINREQDMGDAGLRQAKMTYRPDGFVEKYRLIPPELAERYISTEATTETHEEVGDKTMPSAPAHIPNAFG